MPAQPIFDLDDQGRSRSACRARGARFASWREFTVEGFEPTELAVEVRIWLIAAAFIELVQLQDHNAAVWVSPPQDVDGHAFGAASLACAFTQGSVGRRSSIIKTSVTHGAAIDSRPSARNTASNNKIPGEKLWRTATVRTGTKTINLRSKAWFGPMDRDGFVHRSWMRNQGHPTHVFDGRPVIGICNTWSELTPCNGHFRELAEHVKRGVYEMGGFPVEFPVMSLGETLMRPTTMLFRNLASMDVEESIVRPDGRRRPADWLRQDHAVATDGRGGCGLPTIVCSGGRC